MTIPPLRKEASNAGHMATCGPSRNNSRPDDLNSMRIGARPHRPVVGMLVEEMLEGRIEDVVGGLGVVVRVAEGNVPRQLVPVDPDGGSEWSQQCRIGI